MFYCYLFLIIIFSDTDGLKFTKTLTYGELKLNNTTFKIPSVSYGDAGLYECEAENGVPPIIKSNFSLSIRGTVNQRVNGFNCLFLSDICNFYYLYIVYEALCNILHVSFALKHTSVILIFFETVLVRSVVKVWRYVSKHHMNVSIKPLLCFDAFFRLVIFLASPYDKTFNFGF